jgi:hypothetical protein
VGKRVPLKRVAERATKQSVQNIGARELVLGKTD